jgi:hypothetical protein
MRNLSLPSLAGASALVLLSAVAAGNDGVQVRITNESTQDVIVTVYDMSTRPERVLIENARISGFASMPLEAAGDGSGRATLSWTAVNADSEARRCGEGDGVRVTNAAAVEVSADSSCGA